MGAKLSCREASRLLSVAYERDLTVVETVALKVHLLVCQMCRNFDSQLRFLHKAAGRFREGGK